MRQGQETRTIADGAENEVASVLSIFHFSLLDLIIVVFSE